MRFPFEIYADEEVYVFFFTISCLEASILNKLTHHVHNLWWVPKGLYFLSKLLLLLSFTTKLSVTTAVARVPIITSLTFFEKFLFGKYSEVLLFKWNLIRFFLIFILLLLTLIFTNELFGYLSWRLSTAALVPWISDIFLLFWMVSDIFIELFSRFNSFLDLSLLL